MTMIVSSGRNYKPTTSMISTAKWTELPDSDVRFGNPNVPENKKTYPRDALYNHRRPFLENENG
jgi:hypothetical protein